MLLRMETWDFDGYHEHLQFGWIYSRAFELLLVVDGIQRLCLNDFLYVLPKFQSNIKDDTKIWYNPCRTNNSHINIPTSLGFFFFWFFWRGFLLVENYQIFFTHFRLWLYTNLNCKKCCYKTLISCTEVSSRGCWFQSSLFNFICAIIVNLLFHFITFNLFCYQGDYLQTF